jgi:nitrogen regulatory protein PII
MQLIIGIIRSTQINEVMDNLEKIGIDGLTVSDVKGHGRQKGMSDLYGNVEYVAEFIPKTKIEVIVPDDKLTSATRAILNGAKTGLAGDGLVYSLPLGNVINIRTGNPL